MRFLKLPGYTFQTSCTIIYRISLGEIIKKNICSSTNTTSYIHDEERVTVTKSNGLMQSEYL